MIDHLFGEFRLIRHPVIMMGDIILWFEKHFYRNSVLRGFCLLLFMLMITALTAYGIDYLLTLLPKALYIMATAIIASMFLAHHMLYRAVLELTTAKKPQDNLAMLVSRDTADLSDSDISKAGIETYAENLSDGVVAPLFYLLTFGLIGIMLYKVINTLDSMVGYRTSKYEKFGKASALLDDLVNFIPARLTAMMIMLVSKPYRLFSFYRQGKEHKSPNAGHPITAMALAIGIKLGGPTRYFNQLEDKAFFGEGREDLEKNDIVKCLKIGKKVDFFIVLLLFLASFSTFFF